MICPDCKFNNPDTANFCMNCGVPLKAVIRAINSDKGDEQVTNQNLDKFIPRELMAKLEAARTQEAMIGERRVITMLFCDVKGSTSAAEKVDPEIWSDIMNGIFEFMIRPVYKYEGTIPRLMGDAILAFFGAPIAHEDDPQRAVLAGLEIQEGIKAFVEEIRLKHGLELGLRVGINTGLVIVGEMGSDLRMEYTAIGDAINLAARMEQTAALGTVQISNETYKLVSPFFDFEALGEVEVKGKAAPIKTYRPLGAKKNPGHLRGLDGLTSPLVGRETQLEALNKQMQQLNVGEGSFISVVGEAGLGKSTLIAALKKSNHSSNFTWLEGDSVSYAHSTSYFSWRQIIRQSIGAHEDDAPSDVRSKLRFVCEQHAISNENIPFLETMLTVESKESLQTITSYQGETLVQKITNAAQEYFGRLAEKHPLVITLDDLHWADEATLTLLAKLVTLIQVQPITFICMLRPEKTAASWTLIENIQQKITSLYHLILLEPLPEEQTNILLANLLNTTELPKNIRNVIVERAGGNPFFIEEIIRSLIEIKQIVQKEDHWQAINENVKISLPDTLRGLLGARIDRLPEMTRQVLQTAAVIGPTFDLRVLRQLAKESSDAQIQYLQEAGLVESFHEDYAFRHILIQEAAYDSILIKKRIELHRHVADALEEIHKNRIEEFAPLIAYHFYNAHDAASVKYDILAGENSARLYANAEAATHFSRALEVAKRDKNNNELITKLYTQLGTVYQLIGHFNEALENYEFMLAHGREQANGAIEMSALIAKATIYSIFSSLHNPGLSEDLLLQALEISRRIGDRDAQARLSWSLMLNYIFSRRIPEALEQGELALSLARESNNPEQLAFVLNDLCRLYGNIGEFDRAYATVREAREIWKSLDNQAMLADGLGAEAQVAFSAGDQVHALSCSQEALALSEKTQNLWGQSYNKMLISLSYFELGKVGESLKISMEGVLLGDQCGLLASSIAQRSDLAWNYGVYGEIEKGLELVEHALQLANTKQLEWSALPLAIKVRLQLLKGYKQSAEETASLKQLKPITIPVAHFTILVELANVALAFEKGSYELALELTNMLLDQVLPLTHTGIPEVLWWKGKILLELNQLDEAHQILTKACSLAEKLGSRQHLWSILSSLVDVCNLLNQGEQANIYRKEAYIIVEEIAEGLRIVGLHDTFINLPSVQKLLK